LLRTLPHSSGQTLNPIWESSRRVASNIVIVWVLCENESLLLHFSRFHRRNQRQEVIPTIHVNWSKFPPINGADDLISYAIFFLFLVFYLFMHMHATCWNYEHGTLDHHRMGMQCIFVHSGTLTWYANEMYAYALRDIFLTFFYNGVIVMNLLLYTRKGEGKGRK